MMVDRCHAEQPLSMCLFEISNLQNHRYHFQQINKADNRNEQGKLQRICHPYNKSAQCKGSGISHEYLCRVSIVKKKAKKRSDHCAACRADAVPVKHRRNGKEQCNCDGDAGRETVHAIRKVCSVHGRNRNEYKCWKTENSKIHHYTECERNLHGKIDLIEMHQNQTEHNGNHDLERHLLLHGKTVAASFLHLQKIIDKTDKPEA